MNKDFLQYIKPYLNNSLLAYFESDRPKILFGKGRQARIVTDMCKMLQIEVAGLISSNEEEIKEEFLRNMNSYTIDTFPYDKNDYDVLIAINEKNNSVVKAKLCEKGFSYIFWADNWMVLNRNVRELYFKYIFRKFRINANEHEIKVKNFVITNWKDKGRTYQESFLVEAVDLLYPFLFQDTMACVEGPYEYGKVVLEENDVVIDAGSNLGIFACCAASKNCIAYAFEPTEKAMPDLMENTGRYNSIHVVQAALAEQTGSAKFVVDDTNMTQNRFATGNQENANTEEVKVYALDDFVEENHVERVDFIKADIEGAERRMLLGAKKVLRTYAPKLSICTYHLVDDKEVLAKIILEANPNYIIRYEWNKLYAWTK